MQGPDETVAREGDRFKVRFETRGITWWFTMTSTGPICFSVEADDKGASTKVSRAAAGRAYTLVRDRWEEDLSKYFRLWWSTQQHATPRSLEHLLEEWLRGVALYQEMDIWWKKTVIESLEKKLRLEMAQKGGKTRSNRIRREKAKRAQLEFQF